MLATTINRALTARYRQVNCTLWTFVSCMSISASALLAFSLLMVPVAAQEDTLPEKVGMEAIQLDPSPEEVGTETTQENSLSKETDIETAQKESVQEKTRTEKSELVNIVLGNRRVRAYGWGEYRVAGTCLCCDNKNDGDCIVIHSIERTNRLRIRQIVDGKIEGDTSVNTTYFGDLRKRDRPEHVKHLMVDMSLGKMYEIRKVIVYTMINKEKHTNFLSNCELGYYDQFSRLQWTGRVESKKYDEPITFEMENPILTKKIMLRVKGGKNRITEVAIFCDNKTNEKP